MIEFLESRNGDISVTKFLDDDSPYPHMPEYPHPDLDLEHHYRHDHYYEGDEGEEYGEYEGENALLSNDQSIEKNAKKRGHKKNKSKKSKKPFGGPNEDVVFVEFLESEPYGHHGDEHWL